MNSAFKLTLSTGVLLFSASCFQPKPSPQAEACISRINAEVQQHAPEVRSEKLSEGLHAHVGHLQTLVEQSLTARAEMLAVREALRLRELKEEPISSRELKTLKEGGVAYLGLRK